MKDNKLILKISNTSDSNLVLIIEPWAVENVLESNSSFEVSIEGPDEKVLELECGENMMVIHGWEGSSTTARTGQ